MPRRLSGQRPPVPRHRSSAPSPERLCDDGRWLSCAARRPAHLKDPPRSTLCAGPPSSARAESADYNQVTRYPASERCIRARTRAGSSVPQRSGIWTSARIHKAYPSTRTSTTYVPGHPEPTARVESFRTSRGSESTRWGDRSTTAAARASGAPDTESTTVTIAVGEPTPTQTVGSARHALRFTTAVRRTRGHAGLILS